MPMLHLDQLNHRWVSRFLVARIEDKNHEAFRLQPHPYLDALPPYVNSDPALDPTIFSSYKKSSLEAFGRTISAVKLENLGLGTHEAANVT
jgi:hypothetical protein